MGTDATGKGNWGLSIPRVILFLILSVSAAAESIYVTDHGTNVFAFDVVGDTLVYRQTLTSLTGAGVDLAMDVKSNTLFRSAEFSSTIDLINAESMTHIKTQTFSGPYLTGIVYDDKNNRLLGTERNTNHLYIFSWDAENQTLTLQNPRIELANIQYACDVAIKDDILYVSEYQYSYVPTITVIYAYDMSSDFTYLGQIEMGDPIVSMDYGTPDDTLYGGAWQNSTQLVKYPLDSTGLISKSIGISLTGLCTSRTTPGRVFITTYRNGGTVEIWDTAEWESNPNQTIAPTFTFGNNNSNGVTLSGLAGLIVDGFTIDLFKWHDVAEGDSREPGDTVTYTIFWDNTGDEPIENVTLMDKLPEGVNFDDFVSGTIYQSVPAPADPNVVFALTDDSGLSDITLPVGQSITVYLTKDTTNANIYSFALEADISDPNLGWIDNTEYDPNDPNLATAEILAAPRTTAFDYFGPGSTQEEGIQFFAASFNNPINDGDLASFVYTATEPGYVVLTLVNYDEGSATLEEIVIRQTDPNDPNYVPEEPNEPQGAPVSASSIEGVYNEPNHTVTWELGDIAPDDSGSVSFSVIVNYKAQPGLMLHNVAKLISDNKIVATATEDTLIDCWDTTDPNIIFVDKTAAGDNNGTSWTDAYKNLQDALYRAENTACENVNTIYVAQGEYNPGTSVIDSFVIPDGVSVYGGFKSGGCDFEYRNPTIYVTTLTGYINPNNRNETIVVMGNNSLLGGVIVQDAKGIERPGQGILCENVSAAITNCIVRNNSGFSYGIYADNSDVEIKWCRLENNGRDGIRHIGNGESILVENCQIYDNLWQGIYLESSVSTVKNTVICRNGISEPTFYGVRILNPIETPSLYNNTIAFNYNEAIAYTDNDPNHVNIPDIQNCVIFHNNEQGNGEQFAQWKVYPHYSCVYDPNDPNGESEVIDWRNNFSHKPDFAYPYSDDPNVCINVHLAYDSFCKDKGSPGSYADQNDIDGEARVADEAVDVGADEINCSEIYNVLDWDADGIVNLNEFRKFSDVWLSHDPNDPAWLADPNLADPNLSEGWNPRCNLDTTGDSAYSIDVADLLVFLEDSPWLWVACWRHDIQEMQQMSMMIGGGEQMMMFSTMSSSLESSQPAEAIASAIAEPMEITLATDAIEPEEINPVVERANILSLIEDINVLIDAGGDDAETWREVKNLLKQSLTETEDTTKNHNEF